MSKADKMRGRLATIQKDREEFERQKKELEADMNVGRNNMSKINKGLRNNVILEEPIVVDAQKTPHHHHHNGRTSGGSHTNAHSNGANAQNTPKYGHPEPFFPGSQNMSSSIGANASGGIGSTTSNVSQLNIMPSGPRVSDWCYSAPLDSPAPPQVKSRELYENVRLLGRGSFGEVILVKNVEDNKLFAIKTQLCPKDSEFSNVLREVRFLRTCRHPCIIDVHDAFLITNPRIVYIVMHYCESGTISGVITSAKKNKSNLAESQIVKWVLQLALAMQYLHDNHVVHRDLKPMNVMLTEGGDSLKLADFGLAMSMSEKAEEENTDEAGTPYYTAPEMIQQEPYSYPADCWSFGVIVHQLLALERPFDGSSTADLVKSILSGEIPPLPVHYSEDIKLISRELLRKDQTERLTMTELLLEPMFCSKLASFPQNYRPRTLEERIRRHHQKQLECQMESLNRCKKAEGFKSLHERVALREELAAAAAAATAAAAELNLLTTATEATNNIDHPTPSKTHSVSGSRHSASAPVTNAPTRDGSPISPMLITPSSHGEGSITPVLVSQETNAVPRLSNSNLAIHDTTSTTSTHSTNVTSSSNNATHRRHTEAPAVLSDEVESYIRTSRSNVEDVVHPGEHINISPIDPHSSAASNALRKPSAESMTETESSNNNTDTRGSVSVTSSPTKERPKLAPVDESFSSKTTSVRIDPTAGINIIEEGGVQDSILQGTATESTLSSELATEPINTSIDINNAEERTDNSCEDTPTSVAKDVEEETKPMTSRPTTPYGGRKGQELQKAIENDQVYSILNEQDITLQPGVNGSVNNCDIVQSDQGEKSPNSLTHSFKAERPPADEIILETAV